MARSKKQAGTTRAPSVEFAEKALGDLLAARAEYNPRRMSEHDATQLATSIEQFGLVEPIVWNRRTNHVVGGHQRLAALERMGWAAPVMVSVVDLDLPREQVLNLKLNRTHGDWDWTKLTELVDELGATDAALLADTGFTTGELEALEKDGNLLELEIDAARTERKAIAAVEAGEVDDPGPEEPLGAPVSRRGDLWLLGEHRLLCGDSTSEADVARVLAGEKAELLATDPPYCVDHTGADRPNGSGKDWSAQYNEVDIKDLGEFLRAVFRACLPHTTPTCAVYVWHAHLQYPAIDRVFTEFKILRHQVIVWVKPTSTFGHSYYRWAHEPCAFGWREGNRPPHYLENEITTVWEADWEGKARVVGNEHPTQKPTKLFETPQLQHTKKDAVILEPFSGSGTSLIAAQKLGRRCRALEISPHFVDAAVRRWQRATGGVATLEDGGDSYDNVAATRGAEEPR